MWSHICVSNHGNRTSLPYVVVRTRAKQAIQIQIRRFVGRNKEAKAASKRQRRSLLSQSMHRFMPSQKLVTDLVSSSTRSSSSLPRKLSSSISSSAFDSTDHCQGQKLSATTVKVLSRQFESVRVEQNHCHGLQTVRASYTYRHHRLLVAAAWRIFRLMTMRVTHRSTCFITSISIYPFSQLPCIIVTQRSNDRLGHFRRSYKKVGIVCGRESQHPGKAR